LRVVWGWFSWFMPWISSSFQGDTDTAAKTSFFHRVGWICWPIHADIPSCDCEPGLNSPYFFLQFSDVSNLSSTDSVPNWCHADNFWKLALKGNV
jgi:hypothetical protein